jgi:tetratricopeptide (TPR) repeat protein
MNQVRKHVVEFVKKGAYTLAVRAAAEAVRRNPTVPEFFELLAFAEEIAGFPKAAIQTISRAIALDPNRASFWFQRGRLRVAIRAFSEALVDFDRVIALEQAQGTANLTADALSCRQEASSHMQSRNHVATKFLLRPSYRSQDTTT